MAFLACTGVRQCLTSSLWGNCWRRRTLRPRLCRPLARCSIPTYTIASRRRLGQLSGRLRRGLELTVGLGLDSAGFISPIESFRTRPKLSRSRFCDGAAAIPIPTPFAGGAVSQQPRQDGFELVGAFRLCSAHLESMHGPSAHYRVSAGKCSRPG